MNDIKEVTELLLKFRDERNWAQFHNPKDLALALNIEASELLESFLWKSPEQADVDSVRDELADVFAFAFLLAEKYDFNVKKIVMEKIEKNALKYPVSKSTGNAKKYTEL
jgi:NTP pyrophosphatase (non-canonical NTP hydrolase)